MLNKIGFLHYIKLEWLDATVSHYIKLCDLKLVKEKLDKLVSYETQSSEVKRKTIDVLTRTWIRIPKNQEFVQHNALEKYQKVEPSDYIILHWGMLLMAFPFFRDICSIIGKLNVLYGEIPTNQLHQRMIEKWGKRTSMIRATDRVIQSMIQWKILEKNDSKLLVGKPIKISKIDTTVWFLEALLRSEQTNSFEYDRLITLPTIFPFQIDVPFYYIKKSNRFEYSIHGMNVGMLSLRHSMSSQST